MTQKNKKKVLDVKGTIGVKTKWAITPKQKAEELVEKYKDYAYTNVFSFRIESNLYNAKACAVIAVNEILDINQEVWDDFHADYFGFWVDVKQEIERL
jgi:plasmid rolling circle replication initiator protein Rep